MTGLSATDCPDRQAIEKLRGKVHPDLVRSREIRGGGRADYIPHQVFSRVLTDALDFKWSWYLVDDQIVEIPHPKTGENRPYVKVEGRLEIPGLGSWSAYGVAKLEDEESWKKADTAAFRKACDRAGIAFKTWDDGALYEEEFVEEEEDGEPPVRTHVEFVQGSGSQEEKLKARQTPTTYTDEQKAAMVKLKEYFGIAKNTDLLTLVALWNPEYQGIPRPEDIDDFLAWARVKENVQKCKAALAGDTKSSLTKEQLELLADIKETYSLKSETDLLKLVKAWNPDYRGSLRPEDADAFIDWVRKNPDECDLALG